MCKGKNFEICVYAESICYNISFSFSLFQLRDSGVFQIGTVLNMASQSYQFAQENQKDVVLIIISFKWSLVQKFSRFEAQEVLFVFNLQKPLKWGQITEPVQCLAYD